MHCVGDLCTQFSYQFLWGFSLVFFRLYFFNFVVMTNCPSVTGSPDIFSIKDYISLI